MRILIDADGCPVVDIAVRAALRYGAQCLIFCDAAHVYRKEGAQTRTLLTGADSVDFALANEARHGDIVVTQDYGLAALCLAKGAKALSQNGMEYGKDNIDALLFARHTARKIRRAGGRTKGPPPRQAAQDRAFEDELVKMIAEGEGLA